MVHHDLTYKNFLRLRYLIEDDRDKDLKILN